MTGFVLKIIAMVTMLCDHLGYAIFGKFSAFNYIGRISFPLFAFGISEGYAHTKSKKNYCIRLLMFAIISQVPFNLFCSIFRTTFTLNIFFTLLLGLIAIIRIRTMQKQVCRFIIGGLPCINCRLFKYRLWLFWCISNFYIPHI